LSFSKGGNAMTSGPEATVVDVPGSEGNPLAHTLATLVKVKNPIPNAPASFKKVLRSILGSSFCRKKVI
jgi:hypothetical protein